MAETTHIKKGVDFRVNDIDTEFKLAEFTREHWCVTAPHGTTVQDMLKPEVWANVARRLKPWSIIEVRAEDGSFFAQLVVLAAERTWAKCAVLFEVKLTTSDVSKTQDAGVSGYQYQWKGAKLGHCIIRINDKEPVHINAPSKADALHWLTERKDQLAIPTVP